MSIVRKIALVYAFMFVATAMLSYIPALKDANGYMFGLFSLQYYDDLLHFSSGIWALSASITSTRASLVYFKIFGTMYFIDSLLGFFTGSGILDGGIFTVGPVDLDITTRIFANLPHFFIGGIAIFVGFIIAKKYRYVA